MAHSNQPEPAAPKNCEGYLEALPYSGKTIILDANVIFNDPEALHRYPGGKLVILGTLLSELDGNKNDISIGGKARAFVRDLLRRLRESGADSAELKLENGSQVLLDLVDHSRELKGTSVDRAKADNRGYLAAALFYKRMQEDVLLVTDDNILTITAIAAKVPTQSHLNAPALDHAAKRDRETMELPTIEISDDLMEEFLIDGKIPVLPEFKVRPNEFVQFVSPSHPAAHETVGRYVFRRPVEVFMASTLNDEQLAYPEFKLSNTPFPGTLRVYLNSELLPELSEGVNDGWYYDSGTNSIHLQGRYAQMLYANSSIQVKGQVQAHAMERLKSPAELGLTGIVSRSLEQTMALNVGLDSTVTLIIQEGPAGTSKTWNFVLSALELMKRGDKGGIRNVLLMRPPSEMGGHKSGFLPGDSDEKNLPWMQPVLDNINDVENSLRSKKQTRTEMPPNWTLQDYGRIRGRSLKDTLVGVDEFQNTKPNEAETILERGANGARFIIMGDVSQVDPPLTSESNGLAHMINLVTQSGMTDEQLSHICYIRLTKSVRSDFTQMMIDLSQKLKRQRR